MAVLIIDADERCRDVVAKALSRSGYAIVQADTIAQARNKLNRGYHPLVIVDERLPDGSGARLAKELRERGCSVLLTAGQPEDIARLQCEAEQFMFKPLKLTEVAAWINRHMMHHASSPQHAAWNAVAGRGLGRRIRTNAGYLPQRSGGDDA